jgi:hypothetical protein
MISFGGRSIYWIVKGLDDIGIYDVIPNGRAFLYGLQMYSTWVSHHQTSQVGGPWNAL